MSQVAKLSPDWERLFATALEQEGLFTTQQANEAGYSRPLLFSHVKSGKFVRVRPGIYRVVHFPPGEREDLVMLWLWSHREGVFSHDTALALFGLSDVLPSRIHLTVPHTWAHRRRKLPDALILHHGDLRPDDRTWMGSVQVTTPRRTILDCARDHLAPELLQQAIRQALDRGLVFRDELPAPLQPI